MPPHDVTAWRCGVTALGGSSSSFFFFFHKGWWSRLHLVPWTSFPSASFATLRLWLAYSLIARRRWNGVCDWWSCACICTVARYVDIPLTYRLHCVELKRCERFVICCSNNGASSCAELFLSKIVVLKLFLTLSAIIFAADAILLRKSLRHEIYIALN